MIIPVTKPYSEYTHFKPGLGDSGNIVAPESSYPCIKVTLTNHAGYAITMIDTGDAHNLILEGHHNIHCDSFDLRIIGNKLHLLENREAFNPVAEYVR